MHTAQVCNFLGISTATLTRWKRNEMCKFPRPVGPMENSRPLYYKKSELERFKKSNWFDRD